MKSWVVYGLVAILAVGLAVFVTLAVVARNQALDLIHNPLEAREALDTSPSDFGLAYEDVTVTSEDGFRLAGWYVPGENGAVIMAQHGLKSNRAAMLEEAEMLHDSGYGVLITSTRAHDASEGELISFGMHEMKDWEAWYQFLMGQDDVDPGMIGVLGTSLGATEAIQYASINENIGAVVAHSPFSSIDDTVSVSVTALTGLPPFPFAPLVVFWAEQELGFDSAEIDAKLWIDDISPRAVLILQAGQDTVVSPASGELLLAAAGQPAELWFEPDLGHAAFDTEFPDEFEQRVVGFFDQYLLAMTP
ncbi:MAG: alpha/beta hydrolase [Anaerolineales bacterium]